MAGPQVDNGYVRIASELFDAECRVKMSGSEWQVYRFIQRQTYGWNRKTVQMSMSFIAAGTGLPRPRVAEMLNALVKRNMVLRKNVTHGMNVYEIQKNYKQWVVLRKSGLVRKNVTEGVTKTRTGVLRKSGPKDRQTNNKQKTKPPLTPPQNLNIGAWEQYEQYRAENRIRKLKPPSVAKQQRWLAEQGDQDTQQAIVDESIRNGWQGLHPLKSNGGDKKSSAARFMENLKNA